MAISRFRIDAGGATAVEFGMVALPFLMILGAILETAFGIWATQNLDYALQKASRQIFTGSFQVANSGQTDPSILLGRLKSSLCGTGGGTVVVIFDCQNVKLDVVLANSYANGAVPSAFNTQTQGWSTSAGTQYACAQPGAIVVVTAAVKFPVFFKFLNLGSQNFADGSRMLQSTAVFRTEPYQTTATTGCGS